MLLSHMFQNFRESYLVEEEVEISCIQWIFVHSSICTSRIYIYVAVRRQAEILREEHLRRSMWIRKIL